MAIMIMMTTLLVGLQALSSAASVPHVPGFLGKDNVFCQFDHSNSPAFPASNQVDCSLHCSRGGGCWGFQWDCDGKPTDGKPCVIFRTQQQCGDVKSSGCGSQLYVNTSYPFPPSPTPSTPPPVKPTYDVTSFEYNLLPKWVAQYKLSGQPGRFSLHPNGTVPHPYSPSDIAHVLCFTDQLGNLSESDKDSWQQVINGFQRSDGFFNESDSQGSAGGTLWHAAGYVTSGLSLIQRQPLRRNVMFDRIASTPSLWKSTIDQLLNIDAHAAPNNITSGCSSGYPCAQNIASLVSWYLQTNASTGLLEDYRPFLQWYFPYLSKAADSVTGLWCTPTQSQKHGEINCVGGSFHVDFVFQYVAHHTIYPDDPNPLVAKFPFPAAQMNSSLSLQGSSGGWSPSGLAYIDVDGVYQVTRPSIQLGKSRWADVEKACDRLMALVTTALTDKEILFGSVSSSSHNLPALVSAVAECQTHFPEMIKTVRPWKMCLDDVPYI